MRNGLGHMNGRVRKLARGATYTRKSSEHNLDLAFTSLDAQREACEAYIKSQAQEGWRAIPGRYDDGAFSGASLDRPALQELLAAVRAGNIDIVVVYKVDRLTRSLADFAKLIELFDAHNVSFVSVTQSFNTSSSMGRLTLNVLLSFAQFERGILLPMSPSGGRPLRSFARPCAAKGWWRSGGWCSRRGRTKRAVRNAATLSWTVSAIFRKESERPYGIAWRSRPDAIGWLHK